MAKKVFGIILTIVGCLLILAALFFGVVFGGVGAVMNESANMDDESTQNPTTVSCTGEVVYADDGETTVQYEVDGVIYEGVFNLYSSDYPAGTAVTVYYNENKPEECSVPEIHEAVFGTIGGIFTGFGIGFAIVLGVIGIVDLIVGIILIKSYSKVSGLNSGSVTNNMSEGE